MLSFPSLLQTQGGDERAITVFRTFPQPKGIKLGMRESTKLEYNKVRDVECNKL
jgi:hypothetical protein